MQIFLLAKTVAKFATSCYYDLTQIAALRRKAGWAIIAGIIKVPLEEKRSTQQFRALIDRLAGR